MSNQTKSIQEKHGSERRNDGAGKGSTGGGQQQAGGQSAGGLRQMTGQMIEKISSQARQQLMSKLSGQKDMAAERLVNMSDALRKAGESIQEQAPAFAVDYLTRAADKVERLSGYMGDSDVERMLGDAEGFVRRNPGLVLGTAIAGGFLLGRFLKSSSRADETQG